MEEGLFTAHNLWILIATVLVFVMHLGFASLEAGLVRKKNTVNILFKNAMIISIGLLTYYTIGYGLMYPGGDGGGFFGFGGFGVAAPGDMAELLAGSAEGFTMPSYTDFIFQAMFAATCATIVSGAVAERIKLGAFLIFTTIFVAISYPITGMWQWGGGWLAEMGFYDFAGSTLVHAVGGFAALAGIILLGARKGKYTSKGTKAIPGHSMPFATVGVFLLWFGWFGFNGGSVLSADAAGVAKVFVTTSLAAAGGTMGAFIVSYLMFKTHDLSMVLNGILGGLVGITAGADLMSPFASIIIGLIAGGIIPLSVVMFDKLKLDDPVGATSVHLVCGIWGTLAVGIFGDKAGLGQIGIQLVGVLAIGAFTFIFAFILFYILKVTVGIRVSEEEELKGLDISEHEMSAYPTSEAVAYNLNVQ
jgi:Amt family ammonium transporter